MELKLGYATPEAVRELFAEYTHMLVAHDPYFQAYLDLQHYDAEASACGGWKVRRASSSGCMCAPRFAAGASPGR